MKSSKVLIKRSNSPMQAPKTIEVSERKKKSTSNAHLASNPYTNHNATASNQTNPTKKPPTKEFDTYGKTQKKRNNYLKQLLRTNGESTNKYRIVTEPVEERLLYLGNNNFGQVGAAGSASKIPQSRSKLESHHHHQEYTEKYLKLNIRTAHNSKEKLKTGESFHAKGDAACRNCEKYSYKEQLDYLKKELGKLCMDKILWKSGQMHLDDVKESFFHLGAKANKPHTKDNNNKWTSPSSLTTQKLPLTKLIDKQLTQIRKHFYDLMRDIDSISAIDYPKMLSLNIFKHDPFYTDSPSTQQTQLKQLLSQLRSSVQGRVTPEDLSDIYQYDTQDHSKKIFRNLKNRLGHYMRENLELKVRKEVLERSEEITQESEEYLKRVVEGVLLGWARGDGQGEGWEEEEE